MRKISVVLMLFFVFNLASSQEGKKLNTNDKNAFEQKMLEESKKISTLQCSFIQEKSSELVDSKAFSKGFLYYQSTSKLRWEYTSPTVSTLILNEKAAVLLDKNSKPVGNATALKQLGSIIISMINGKGLTKNKQFSSDIYDSGNGNFLVVLVPVQKRLRSYYQSIEIKIEKKTYLASEICMNEKSGDKMTIYFSNLKLNEKISSDKFEIK